MRAVVLDPAGQPELTDLPEPSGEGELVRVRACGLCGSDVEKLGSSRRAGEVLGHEVVGETEDGRRVTLVHHLPCGECERCRAGHESTCEQFRTATIVPGGFAERARAKRLVELPGDVDDLVGTFAEPLACVLRAAERVPRGRVCVVGCGFVGQLFVRVLRRRGDDVYAVDPRPQRLMLAGARPPEEGMDAAVLCAPGAGSDAIDTLDPGGLLVVFAPGGPLDLDEVYRRELDVAGVRSATPAHLEQAVGMLGALDPLPVVELPLERFHEGLDLYRRGDALKVVFRP